MGGDGIHGSGSTQRSDGRGLTARHASLVDRMRSVARSVQAVSADSALRARLSQGDFQALVRVAAADGLTGAEVRRILGVTSSSVTELADRLEQAGMISRTSRPSDRRVVVLKPTPRGKRVLERALAPVLAAMASVADGLSDDELDVVTRFLDQVERRLGEISHSC